MNFKDFKKNKGNFLETLNQKIKESNTTFEPDARYFQVTKDKAGNGVALVRFLPGKDTPWVRYWSHSFEYNGGWYIENSRTSLKEDDPVSEYNKLLWDSGKEEYKEFVSLKPGTKRKLNYVSNIYVIEDPANPENNGKVFLYQYGAKIYDKIKALMQPSIKTLPPVNPFNPFDGANLQIIIKKVAGYPNYDDTKFIQEGSKLGNDDEIEKIYNQQYDLEDILKESNFKPYEKLKARLIKVLGKNAPLMEEYLSNFGEVVETKKESTTPPPQKKKEEIDVPFDTDTPIDEEFIKALATS